MKVKFYETIANPIFTFSLKDIKGTEITGINTVIEKVDEGIVQAGQTVTIEFRQKMMIQGGQHLSLGCTGFEKGNLVGITGYMMYAASALYLIRQPWDILI